MASFRPSTALRYRVRCSVCHDDYDNKTHVPKFLPCQHSVCQSCLTKLCKGKTKITCPLCRASHKVPSRGFPTNRAVLDIVEDLPISLKCDSHGSMNSVLVCTDCLEGLCPRCIIERLHEGHQIEEPDQAEHHIRDKLQHVERVKQRALDSSYPHSASEILKTKEDVEALCVKMHDALSNWENEQLSALDKLEQDAFTRARELESAQMILSSLSVGSDLGSVLENLKTVNEVSVGSYREGNDHHDIATQCHELQRQVHQVIGKRTPGPSSHTASSAGPFVSSEHVASG